MINNYLCNLKQLYSVTVCFSPFTTDYTYTPYISLLTIFQSTLLGLSFMNFHQFQFGVTIKTEILKYLKLFVHYITAPI